MASVRTSATCEGFVEATHVRVFFQSTHVDHEFVDTPTELVLKRLKHLDEQSSVEFELLDLRVAKVGEYEDGLLRVDGIETTADLKIEVALEDSAKVLSDVFEALSFTARIVRLEHYVSDEKAETVRQELISAATTRVVERARALAKALDQGASLGNMGASEVTIDQGFPHGYRSLAMSGEIEHSREFLITEETALANLTVGKPRQVKFSATVTAEFEIFSSTP